MFYVVLWVMWGIRNKIVFHDVEPNWEFEKRERFFWHLGSGL